jgi:hypothetical protein
VVGIREGGIKEGDSEIEEIASDLKIAVYVALSIHGDYIRFSIKVGLTR